MAAFNWIVVEATCPACGSQATLRCQTHVASDFAGDGSRRFHDREYRVGDSMAWWPSSDSRFPQWRANRTSNPRVDPNVDEEACHATCNQCAAPLFVILRFYGVKPDGIVAVGREDDWPAGYLK